MALAGTKLTIVELSIWGKEVAERTFCVGPGLATQDWHQGRNDEDGPGTEDGEWG